MNRCRKVRLTNLKTNEVKDFDSVTELSLEIGYSYQCVMTWLHGRSKNLNYKVEYID